MDSPQIEDSNTADRITRWCLFLGILVWFTDLEAIYALPSLACEWSWFQFTVAGIQGLAAIEVGISMVGLLLMAPLVYLPWRNWRRFQTEKPRTNPRLLKDTEMDRRPLLAFVAMLMNGFFFLFMIATFVPVFALNVCARG